MEFRGRFLKTPNSILKTEADLMNKGLRLISPSFQGRMLHRLVRNIDLMKKGLCFSIEYWVWSLEGDSSKLLTLNSELKEA